MPVHSKPLSSGRLSYFDSVPYTCYELGHTWDPNCFRSLLYAFKDSLINALKIYIPFYLVASFPKLRHKKHRKPEELKKVLTRILRSSIFLSVHGTSSLGGFCILRHLLGRFYGWHALVIGFVLGYFGLDMETKSRKGLITIATSIWASETLFNMAVSRQLARPIPNAEVMIFCLASAGLMALYRTPEGLSEGAQHTLHLFLGSCEVERKKVDFITSRWSSCCRKVPDLFLSLLQRLKSLHSRHVLCSHEHSCLFYIIEGFCRNFLIGFSIDGVFHFLHMLRGRTNNSLFQKFSLSLFFGSYSALFRACNCLLRWIRNKDSPAIHGAIAGAVAGVASWFYKSSTISLYFLFKLLEVLVHKGVEKKLLPHITKGHHYLYSISLAVLLNAALLEPHNIPTKFWKLLCDLSSGRFRLLFRKLLDVYGTNASAIDPGFVPTLYRGLVQTPAVAQLLSDHGRLR